MKLMKYIMHNGRVNLVIIFSGLLVTGIASGTMIKFQQRSVVNGVQFNHPFMQTLMMFIGEMLCYVCFTLYKCFCKQRYLQDRQEEIEQGKIEKVNKLLFIIPALLDYLGSSLTLFSMSMMPFSVYYMMRGGGVIITAIFSVIILKTELYKQNYVGLLFNFVGFLTVGISAVLLSDTDQDTTYLIFGIMLIIVSLFTQAFQLIFEERIFKKYSINPLEEMGWEGIWGTLFTSLSLAIFVHISCPETIQNCPHGKLEDVSLFFNNLTSMQGRDQPKLLYIVIFTIFVLTMLNGFSVSVTKYSSSINKSMVSAVSPFIVWIITICLEWDEFNYGQFTGYSIITLGTLIYNEVIVVPFWGMNKHLKKNKNKMIKQHQQYITQKRISKLASNYLPTQENNSHLKPYSIKIESLSSEIPQ